MTNRISKTNNYSTFFWNVLGSLIIGFGSFVFTSNITGLVIMPILDYNSDVMHIWELLTADMIPLYGLFLLTVSITAVVLIAWRALNNRIMGYKQLLTVVATSVTLATIIIWA